MADAEALAKARAARAARVASIKNRTKKAVDTGATASIAKVEAIASAKPIPTDSSMRPTRQLSAGGIAPAAATAAAVAAADSAGAAATAAELKHRQLKEEMLRMKADLEAARNETDSLRLSMAQKEARLVSETEGERNKRARAEAEAASEREAAAAARIKAEQVAKELAEAKDKAAAEDLRLKAARREEESRAAESAKRESARKILEKAREEAAAAAAKLAELEATTEFELNKNSSRETLEMDNADAAEFAELTELAELAELVDVTERATAAEQGTSAQGQLDVNVATDSSALSAARLKEPEEERAATKKLEEERVAAEKLEEERVASEKAAEEHAAAKKLEEERVAAEKAAEEERAAAKKLEEERVAAKKLEEERVAAEKAAEEERAAAKKLEEEHVAAEKTAEEERAAAKKLEEERIAAEKAAEEERTATKKLEEERVVTEEDRAAAEKLEEERVAAEKAAEEERAAAEAAAADREAQKKLAELRKAEAERAAADAKVSAAAAVQAEKDSIAAMAAAADAEEKEVAAMKQKTIAADVAKKAMETAEKVRGALEMAANAKTAAASAKEALAAALATENAKMLEYQEMRKVQKRREAQADKDEAARKAIEEAAANKAFAAAAQGQAAAATAKIAANKAKQEEKAAAELAAKSGPPYDGKGALELKRICKERGLDVSKATEFKAAGRSQPKLMAILKADDDACGRKAPTQMTAEEKSAEEERMAAERANAEKAKAGAAAALLDAEAEAKARVAADAAAARAADARAAQKDKEDLAIVVAANNSAAAAVKAASDTANAAEALIAETAAAVKLAVVGGSADDILADADRASEAYAAATEAAAEAAAASKTAAAAKIERSEAAGVANADAKRLALAAKAAQAAMEKVEDIVNVSNGASLVQAANGSTSISSSVDADVVSIKIPANENEAEFNPFNQDSEPLATQAEQADAEFNPFPTDDAVQTTQAPGLSSAVGTSDGDSVTDDASKRQEEEQRREEDTRADEVRKAKEKARKERAHQNRLKLAAAKAAEAEAAVTSATVTAGSSKPDAYNDMGTLELKQLCKERGIHETRKAEYAAAGRNPEKLIYLLMSYDTPDDLDASAAADSKASKPRTREDVDFIRVLGEGSFSTVHLATEVEGGRFVAVKVMDKAHIAKEGKEKYITTEREMMERLSKSPFVVTLFYMFEDTRNLYFVLENADNGELQAWLNKLGSFDEECTRFYSAEILSGLEHIHAQGIIHRDIKPENILLSQKMHVKICDFGSARAISEKSECSEAHDNSFVGTAQYVSPEVLSGKSTSSESDIWALGCIIYQLAVGNFPFVGNNEYQTFKKIKALDFTVPEGFWPTAKSLVESILVLDPGSRLGSAQSGGISNIKAHPFWKALEWSSLHLTPPPPLQAYVPAMQGHEDEELRGSGDGDGGEDDIDSLLNKAMRRASVIGELEAQQKQLEAQNRIGLLQKQREESPFAHLCAPGELIVKHGLVEKRKGFSVVKRQLILTDAPRLFYVEPNTMVIKGEIPWPETGKKGDYMTPEFKTTKTFFVHTPDRTYYLEDLGKKSAVWIDTINSVLKMARERTPALNSLSEEDGIGFNREVSARDPEMVLEAAKRLRQGVPPRDRFFHMVKYKRVFTGSDAVSWLVNEKLCPNQASSVALGKQMVAQGLFRHVADDHDFENKFLFYRWNESAMVSDTSAVEPSRTPSDIDEISTLAEASSAANDLAPREMLLYTVSVKTAADSELRAGDSQVSVQIDLMGTRGDSGTKGLNISLSKTNDVAFGAGQTDIFEFKLADLGDITRISLEISESHKKHNMWHLGSVTVTASHPAESGVPEQKFEFACKQWFGKHNGRVHDFDEVFGDGEQTPHGAGSHVFKTKSYTKPTFCSACKKLLWGAVKQGLQCKCCKLNVHRKCVSRCSRHCVENIGGDDDDGVCHFKVKNYRTPTFCAHCKGLLWGAVKQGLHCKGCRLNVHRKCVDLLQAKSGKCGDHQDNDDTTNAMDDDGAAANGVKVSATYYGATAVDMPDGRGQFGKTDPLWSQYSGSDSPTSVHVWHDNAFPYPTRLTVTDLLTGKQLVDLCGDTTLLGCYVGTPKIKKESSFARRGSSIGGLSKQITIYFVTTSSWLQQAYVHMIAMDRKSPYAVITNGFEAILDAPSSSSPSDGSKSGGIHVEYIGQAPIADQNWRHEFGKSTTVQAAPEDMLFAAIERWVHKIKNTESRQDVAVVAKLEGVRMLELVHGDPIAGMVTIPPENILSVHVVDGKFPKEAGVVGDILCFIWRDDELDAINAEVMICPTVNGKSSGQVLEDALRLAMAEAIKKQKEDPFFPTSPRDPKNIPTVAGIAEAMIDRKQFTAMKLCGEGEFGSVYLANQTIGDEVTVRAVKTIRQNALNYLDDFVSEAAFLRNMHHKTVINCVGVCMEQQPFLVVLEYCMYGDAQKALQGLKAKGIKLTGNEQAYILLQLADALRFVASKKIVHLDVAARNLLLHARTEVKLADFGLARPYDAGKETFALVGTMKLPFKWVPYECLCVKLWDPKTKIKYRPLFGEHSDVWAFGVVCSEVLNYGAEPYRLTPKSKQLIQLLKEIYEGLRLTDDVPDDTDPVIKKVMCMCFTEKADRPTFDYLVQALQRPGERVRDIGALLNDSLDSKVKEMSRVVSVRASKRGAEGSTNSVQHLGEHSRQFERSASRHLSARGAGGRVSRRRPSALAGVTNNSSSSDPTVSIGGTQGNADV